MPKKLIGYDGKTKMKKKRKIPLTKRGVAKAAVITGIVGAGGLNLNRMEKNRSLKSRLKRKVRRVKRRAGRAVKRQRDRLGRFK